MKRLNFLQVSLFIMLLALAPVHLGCGEDTTEPGESSGDAEVEDSGLDSGDHEDDTGSDGGAREDGGQDSPDGGDAGQSDGGGADDDPDGGQDDDLDGGEDATPDGGDGEGDDAGLDGGGASDADSGADADDGGHQDGGSVDPDAGGGDDGGDSDDEDCDPQEARGVGMCQMFLGYVWDGEECKGVSGCSCEGDDCDDLFGSFEDCEEAYRGCD
ncbi:MAG: hypothetical protein ACOCV2_03705 [Persicimonas sp.]